MHIVIFGGGVVGILTAYSAVKNGHKVTLIEKNPDILQETSSQNGGQLSFSHVTSLFDLNLFKYIFKNLYSNQSPITINHLNLIGNLNWCYNFIRNKSSKLENLNSLFILANLSREIFKDINSEFKDSNISQTGTIHFFRNQNSYKKTLKHHKLLEIHNIEHLIIHKNQIKDHIKDLTIEPKVNSIYYPKDYASNAKLFSSAILDKLKKNNNFTLLTNQKITDVYSKNNTIKSFTFNDNIIHGDKFIIATGANYKEFNKLLNINIPIRPLKGYSLNINQAKIKHSIIDHDEKIVYASLGNITRIAGLCDFTNINKAHKKGRLEYLKKKTHDILGKDNLFTDEWCGFRPLSMDKLPIIGKSNKYNNLHFNMAHANLGWTLSTGSSFMLINSLNYDEDPKYLKSFTPKRFNNRVLL